MGTGTGIIAIFFELIKRINQKFSPQIFASDILVNAIKCAKSNEKLNKIENKINFIQSNLFDSFSTNLKNKFDILVFNPPYLPALDFIDSKNHKINIDYSWNGGKSGYELFLRFLNKVKNFLNLTHNCYIYYVSSSRIDLKEFNRLITQKGFINKVLTKKHTFFEDIILNRAKIIQD